MVVCCFATASHHLRLHLIQHLCLFTSKSHRFSCSLCFFFCSQDLQVHLLWCATENAYVNLTVCAVERVSTVVVDVLICLCGFCDVALELRINCGVSVVLNARLVSLLLVQLYHILVNFLS